jgi:hypothetical protein
LVYFPTSLRRRAKLRLTHNGQGIFDTRGEDSFPLGHSLKLKSLALQARGLAMGW